MRCFFIFTIARVNFLSYYMICIYYLFCCVSLKISICSLYKLWQNLSFFLDNQKNIWYYTKQRMLILNKIHARKGL